MRTAKSQMAVSVAALCIVMFMYSPLCNIKCALNSCTFTKAETAKPAEQSGHCHGSDKSKETSSPPQHSHSAPRPHNDSSNCPSHVDGVAVVPSTINANAGLHQDMQPVAAELVSVAAFHLDLRGAIRAEGTAFR